MLKHLFINPEQIVLKTGHLVRLDNERSNYISRVLRARKGDSFVVFDGSGSTCLATVETSISGKTELSLGDVQPVPNKDGELILLASVISHGLEDLVQKATELGVTRIVIAPSSRSQLKKPRIDRLKKIVISACEQSLRMWLPELELQNNIIDVFQTITCQQKLIGDTSVSQPSIIKPQNTCLAIGPEGGWTKDEIVSAKLNGFSSIGMGPLTLRSTTAATVALGLIRHANQWLNPIV